MFATKALFFLPVVLFGLFVSGGEGEVGHVNRTPVFFTIYTSGAVWIATAILTLFSTVYGYATMTRWQPCVSSVQAGLIYATEPVFATLWALFLPGAYSAIGAIHYPNEQLGAGFLWGAGLVMAANALLLFQHGSGHAAQPPRPCVESR
jgi:hypothetical protein